MAEVADIEKVDIPASEKVAINRMADKFKDAMKQTKPAAIAPVQEPSKPAEAPKPEPAKPADKPAAPEKPAPTAAPEQPKPAAAVEPTAPPEMKGKAREQWEKLESEMKKWRGDYEAVKPQLDALAAEKAAWAAEQAKVKSELEAAKKGTAEYEALKAEYEKNKKLVDEFYVERSPQFQAHFGQRLQAAKMEATDAVGPEKSEALKTILEMQPSRSRYEQVKAIGAELDDFDRAALVAAYHKLEQTERERNSELAKAPENRKKLEELEAQEAARQAQERASHMTKVRTRLLEDVQKQIDPELNGYPEGEAIKTEIKQVIFNEATSEAYVGLLADGARWRRHQSSLKEKDELIGKLQAQLNEVQASNPSVRSNGATQTRKATPPADNSDMGDIFRKARDGK